jgi:hypothetical protein
MTFIASGLGLTFPVPGGPTNNNGLPEYFPLLNRPRCNPKASLA